LKPPNWLLNPTVTISPVLEGRCNRRWWNRMIERAGKDMSSTWQGTWMQQWQRTIHCPCEKVQESGKSKVCRSMCTKGNLLPNLFHWDSTLNATDLEHNKVKNYKEVTLTVVQRFAYSNLNKVCQVLRSKNRRSMWTQTWEAPSTCMRQDAWTDLLEIAPFIHKGTNNESLFTTPEVQLTK
jgi:hypothetical protein